MQNKGTSRIIWVGDTETDCAKVCGERKRAGIVYR